MICKLASKAAENFIKRPNTCYNKIEIYQYGFATSRNTRNLCIFKDESSFKNKEITKNV